MVKKIILRIYGIMKLLETKSLRRFGITEEELYAVRYRISRYKEGGGKNV